MKLIGIVEPNCKKATRVSRSPTLIDQTSMLTWARSGKGLGEGETRETLSFLHLSLVHLPQPPFLLDPSSP